MIIHRNVCFVSTFWLFLALNCHPHSLHAQLEITQLTPEAFVYTTYHDYNGTKFPANGLYVVTGDGVVLLDTPWDTAMFQPLLDSIDARHKQPVKLCIATHFHADRTAGLEYYTSKGISTWTSVMTHQLCEEHNEKKAAFTFLNDTIFKLGGYSFETFYPGEGHTPDNIVIWIPELKILHGGCFVKSTAVDDLGNLSDASPVDWKVSTRRVLEKYPGALHIIPGHFAWTKKNALKHTLKLLNKYLKKQNGL